MQQESQQNQQHNGFNNGVQQQPHQQWDNGVNGAQRYQQEMEQRRQESQEINDMVLEILTINSNSKKLFDSGLKYNGREITQNNLRFNELFEKNPLIYKKALMMIKDKGLLNLQEPQELQELKAQRNNDLFPVQQQQEQQQNNDNSEDEFIIDNLF